MKARYFWLVLSFAFFYLAACTTAHDASGKVETFTVTAESLRDNLVGDPAERQVLVYLPPSYHTSDHRYPVLYTLHGWGGNAQAWFSDSGGDPDLQGGLEALLETGEAKEMIIVVPDVSTRHFSSWFRSSPVTGDWESYLTDELVEAIDSHYRTLAKPESRGLIGHSSGGQGVFHLALSYPEQYGAAYAMAPANVEPGLSAQRIRDLFYQRVEPQLAGYTGEHDQIDQSAHYFLSVAQLYMFDPDNGPAYIQKAPTMADFEKMATFNVSHAIDVHADDFASGRYNHLRMKTDVGTQENRTESFKALQARLTQLGMNIELHTFDAGHVDKMDESALEVLKFMSESLAFE